MIVCDLDADERHQQQNARTPTESIQKITGKMLHEFGHLSARCIHCRRMQNVHVDVHIQPKTHTVNTQRVGQADVGAGRKLGWGCLAAIRSTTVDDNNVDGRTEWTDRDGDGHVYWTAMATTQCAWNLAVL